ncbi:MAG: methionine adenosyltransferase domain-containing protein [Elusimicrobiaceae bacterium]|nr:methionine adenosyltransferase domain-containing protein [Elusimicrobiaceae bacterium]MBR4355371.1 methionine adenosyltransferase domain-containing protein [Elusimicrobiaceae bacterium]
MQISEYVSLGHPDKVADYISSYLLDQYIKKDKYTRYAVECQIKGNVVNLAGEITSKAKFTKKQIANFVKAAVNQIGYTKHYQRAWGKENTICGADLKVNTYISEQSTDIAHGLDGWGDQGIFFGCAYPRKDYDYLEGTQYLSKIIGEELYKENVVGKDIKVLVVKKGKNLSKVIVAAPINTVKQLAKSKVLKDVKAICDDAKCPLIINGTGLYRKHGPLADSGTTGRKLAVDFYGGSCRIGGGSPWTKDGTKADLTLNLYARYLALKFLKEHKLNEPVFCDIACCIGQREIDICLHDANGVVFQQYSENKKPHDLIKFFHLDKPIYAKLCREGLFSEVRG